MRCVCLLAALLMASAHAQLPSTSSGQALPNRPLRIVIPAAGGSPDVIARDIAAQFDGLLDRHVSVDNRGGANGISNAKIVARATPDGHTLPHTPPAFVRNALVQSCARPTSAPSSAGYVRGGNSLS